MIAFLLVTVGIFIALRRRRVLSHRRRHDKERANAYEDFAEIVLVSLHTGLSLHEAVETAAHCSTGTTRSDIARLQQRLAFGEPITDVLPALTDIFGSRALALVDILHSSVTDGIPVLHVIERLADEARHERRRRLDGEIRTVPVRLVFPLTLCVLPSFVLLTIAPVAIRTISTLT